MQRKSSLRIVLAATGLLAGCNLSFENPNAPTVDRAFIDPSGLQQLLGGAFRTWVETRGDYFGVLPMTTMADNYTASWNNAAIRHYSSVGADGCASRCGWNNSAVAAEAAGGPSVESQWYGYNTVLSSANDVLFGVANDLCFDDDCATDNTLTSRNTAVAKMLQGMAFAGIALVYDQGFVVTEESDLSDPASIPFSTREEMRDAALLKFEEAWTEAGLKSWTTPSEWMGVGSGTSYSNQQIRQVIRTMQAELLALFPRNAAENAAVPWGQVATYASQGVSSGAPFDWEFFIDITGRECGLDCVKTWGNSLFTMRVDNRVAAILTTNHVNPWPEAAGGNPCPTISADLRVGDGSYGPSDDFSEGGTLGETPNAGTDYACSTVPIFDPARGQYHQSNLQHIRYQHLAYRGENLPGFNATGQDPFYTTQMNDLLWAEGLLRGSGSPALAAQLINNSRNGRGGLPQLTGAEGTPTLIDALLYEQEIEFMGQGPTPFFNRRRVDGLIAGTPRHMPVPAKEMDVLRREVYTFGGDAPRPDMSVARDGDNRRGSRVRSVREIWKEYLARRPSTLRRF